MPIYTFKCDDCDHMMEDFFHYTQESMIIECTECGGQAPKVFAPASVVVKGKEQKMGQLRKTLQEDRERIAKGDTEFIQNLIGDPSKKPSTDSGSRKLDQVSKSVIKRRK